MNDKKMLWIKITMGKRKVRFDAYLMLFLLILLAVSYVHAVPSEK